MVVESKEDRTPFVNLKRLLNPKIWLASCCRVGFSKLYGLGVTPVPSSIARHDPHILFLFRSSLPKAQVSPRF